MHIPFDLSNEQRRENERKILRAGLVASLVFHVLVFVVFSAGGPLDSPFAAAGPQAGDDRAASGGLQAMNIRVPPPRPIIPPKIPLPLLIDVQPVEFEDDVLIETASILGENPGEEGPGLDMGDGKGDGGTAEEGRFRVVPPSPRGMIIPPANKSLKGQRVQVWVFVNVSGRVVADSTKLRPPTSDRDFNERLIREAAEWIFEPGRKGGKPVATWFPYTISM